MMNGRIDIFDPDNTEEGEADTNWNVRSRLRVESLFPAEQGEGTGVSQASRTCHSKEVTLRPNIAVDVAASIAKIGTMRCNLPKPTIFKDIGGCLLLLLLVSSSLEAQANDGVHVRAAEFNSDGELSAVWHDLGIHFVATSAGDSFVCNKALPVMGMITRTGHERLLSGGEEGAALTLTQGCKWKQTTGTFAFDRVVGMYREPGDAERILLAFGDHGIVVESLDGGHTTNEEPVLSVGNVEFYAMVGEGEHVLISGRSELTGDRKLWRSHDSGHTFEEESLGEGPDQVPWLLDAAAAWVGEGSDLVRLAVGTGLVESRVSFTEPPMSVTRDPVGTIWVALGPAGLWRLGDDEDAQPVQERIEPATWVRWTAGGLWVGGIGTQWNEPVLWTRSLETGEWLPRFHFAPDPLLGVGCPTLLSQSCAQAVQHWTLDWGGEEPEIPESAPNDPGEASGCTITTSTESARFPLILLLLTSLGVAWNRIRNI
jgi:hypothetical protein